MRASLWLLYSEETRNPEAVPWLPSSTSQSFHNSYRLLSSFWQVLNRNNSYTYTYCDTLFEYTLFFFFEKVIRIYLYLSIHSIVLLLRHSFPSFSLCASSHINFFVPAWYNFFFFNHAKMNVWINLPKTKETKVIYI